MSIYTSLPNNSLACVLCFYFRLSRAFARLVFPSVNLAAPLGWSDLCAISGFSLTARAGETRARRVAVLVRPQIQKVRIC